MRPMRVTAAPALLSLARVAVQWTAFALIALFLVGFAGQFLPVRRFPFLVDVLAWTRPVSQSVRGMANVTYRGIDGSLLLAAVLVGVLYTVADRLIVEVENASRRRRFRARVATEAAARSARPATPSPGVRSGGGAYRPEALLVIDIVNSTILVTRFGNSFMADVKQRLEHLVSPISLRHGADFTKGTGDGFLITFPSVTQAISAIREIYGGLAAANDGLPEGAEVALRAGLNFGEVIVDHDSDRTGSAVHKTFRLQSVGPKDLIPSEGGITREEFPEKNYVVLGEEATLALAKAPDTRCRFLGLCELKGFPGIHRIYQLEWDTAPA